MTDFDRLGITESHGSDFGTSFGDPFTYVVYAPAPTYTEVRNRLFSVKPNLLSDPGLGDRRNAPTPAEINWTEFGAGFCDQSTYDTYIAVPIDTGDGNRLLSTDSDQLGDTESHGAGFGEPFTFVTCAPAPDDTEDGERLLLTDSDRSRDTESHGSDFGASFGDPFTYVVYTPEPDDTGVGDRPPSLRPDRSGDPDGKTESIWAGFDNPITGVIHTSCLDV